VLPSIKPEPGVLGENENLVEYCNESVERCVLISKRGKLTIFDGVIMRCFGPGAAIFDPMSVTPDTSMSEIEPQVPAS
jgi:hypothetical protein